MDEGVMLDKKNKTQKALDKYMYAKSLVKNDTLIMKTLDRRIDQIALLWMLAAENMLKEFKYDEAYNLVKHVAEFSIHGKKELRRFKSWVVLGEGKKYQNAGFIGKAMGKYANALEMNPDLIYEVKSLQYRAGIQMAKLATEADEFEEIQLAIHSLEFARELSGGIGKRNEQLLLDLNQKLKTLSDYNTRILIEQKMNLARTKQAIARSEKLKIGQTIPQVQALLGEPHEKIIGSNGSNPEEQLWIYFVNQKSLQLSFHYYQLFKIEKL
jgi:tetratricopeptide (TPR) repeat protein